jgi:hypothetical protein
MKLHVSLVSFIPIWILNFYMIDGSPAYGDAPARVEVENLSGQCEGTEVNVKQFGSEYYVHAFFNDSMFISTDPGSKNFDSKRCTLDLKLIMEPGYRFDSFTFTVDGAYQISDQGTVRVTISNTLGHGPAFRTTGFFSLSGGSNVQGELVPGGFAGSVFSHQLEESLVQCGSQIPLEVSLFATATQPNSDTSGVTFVQLDEGRSSISTLPYEVCQGTYCVGKLTVQKCSP